MKNDKKIDKYSMMYHLTPKFGLLNDPNGLINYKDEYYVFYQWNKFETNHSYKCWAYFKSKDMVNWTDMSVALLPDMYFDKNGVYSGSAIENDGKINIFYTGNVKNELGERKSYQCKAESSDGRIFEKKGVIFETPPGYSEHFRDPKVFKGKNNWWMVIGAQTEKLEGAVVLYKSYDLNKWEYCKTILKNNDLDNMCECPDILRFDEGDILLCSPQKRFENKVIGKCGYFKGHFLEDKEEFKSNDCFHKIDYGFNFHSPQTFTDKNGRVIVYGGMAGMTEEEEEALPTRKFGYVHSLSIPRVLTYKNNTLYQSPVEELKKLRGNEEIWNNNESNVFSNFQLEFLFDFPEVMKEDFTFKMRGNIIEVKYDVVLNLISIKRYNWSTHKIQESIINLEENLKNMQLFLEESSFELFINDGKYVCTLRYFCDTDYNDINIKCDDNVRIKFYQLKL